MSFNIATRNRTEEYKLKCIVLILKIDIFKL